VPPIDASLIRGIQDRSERFRVATEGSALRCLHDREGGRPLAAEEMPVAATLVNQQRSRQRWLVPFSVLLVVSCFFQGLSDHGFMRWAGFGLFACGVIAITLQLREQRQLIRNYERQNIPNVGDHGGRSARNACHAVAAPTWITTVWSNVESVLQRSCVIMSALKCH
jgi:hypothetical protein